MSTDEGLTPEDPTVWRIQARVRELETEKQTRVRELRDLDEDLARVTNRRRWANEAIAALEVERDLLQAWLNTSAAQ